MKGSIQKKGDTYYVVFRTVDPTGKLKQKWERAGKSKKEAEILLTETIGEIHSGTYRELKRASFRQYAREWLLSYAKTTVKTSTFKSYQNIINNHLIPRFGDQQITDISPSMLQRYVASRLSEKSKYNKPVKPKTIVNEIVIIKELFKYAVIWGYLKNSPAEYLKRPKVEHEEMDFLRPDEINVFLEHLDSKSKIVFLTAILTGMRRGEILGLQWGDIDFYNNQIHVRRSLWKNQFISPKSKRSVRKIDMTPLLSLELKKHKLVCPKSELDLVFPNSDGKPLDPNNLIKRHYVPALRRAKLRLTRFHNLRHTNVALRIEQNQNSKYIQRQLGHASITTTLDRYGHLINDSNAHEASKLDYFLTQNSVKQF